tara:strand:+ start:1179 stop:2159 length:981 start_codon:yes stop_codon:yes gene_type:complete
MTTAYSGDGITFPDNSVQATAPKVGMVNRVINGDMRVSQRNGEASLTFTGSLYTLDRWKLQTSTGGAVQKITSTIPEFAKSFKYTSNASNSFLQMGQAIEYLNCYDLQNKTVTISFWVKANNSNAGSTAFKVRTRISAAVDTATIFSAPNTDTAVTITTTATKYTVTRTLSTFGSLSLEFVLGAHVSGDGFEITGVQLEKGSTATDFEYVDYGRQLIQCQRYFEKSYNQDVVPGVASFTPGFASSVSSSSAPTQANGCSFKVVKRANPDVVTFNAVTGASGKTYRVSDGASVTTTLTNAGHNGIGYIDVPSSANGYYWHFTATAEL